jgi:hypothetical protein
MNARDLHFNPHHQARGLLEMVDYPPDRKTGRRPAIGRPWKLSKLPLKIRGPGPKLGGNNEELLCSLLGYSAEKYAELEKAAVIGTQPKTTRQQIAMPMEDRVKTGRLAAWDPDYKEKLGI